MKCLERCLPVFFPFFKWTDAAASRLPPNPAQQLISNAISRVWPTAAQTGRIRRAALAAQAALHCVHTQLLMNWFVSFSIDYLRYFFINIFSKNLFFGLLSLAWCRLFACAAAAGSGGHVNIWWFLLSIFLPSPSFLHFQLEMARSLQRLVKPWSQFTR